MRMLDIMGKDGGGELARVFGRNLRKARLALGITQYDLAERASVGQKYLSDVEVGRRRVRLDTAIRLTAAVGKSVDDLCSGAPGEEAKGRVNQTPWANRIKGLVASLSPEGQKRAWQFLRAAFGSGKERPR